MKHDIPSSTFKLEIPEYYNFAYDVIDRRGLEERTRLAMIWVSDRGASRKLTSTSSILSTVSRRHYITANRLLNYPSPLLPPSPSRSPTR